MIGKLPTDLEIDGIRYTIRTDFRDVLTILEAFNDPELEDKEKVLVCLTILYEDFDSIPPESYEAAFRGAMRFIGNTDDIEDDGKHHPKLVDWEQDETLLFPAVNKAAGFETRSAEYIHWWTFLGYFMEISEGVYSEILNLRAKKAKNKRLEKWEQEFWAANKKACVLRTKLSAEEQAAKDALNALLS